MLSNKFLLAGSQNGKKPKKSILRTLFCCCVSGENDNSSTGNGCVPEDVPPYNLIPPPTGPQRHLLPPVSHRDMHKICMVIDLDETLVHSSFKVCDTINEFVSDSLWSCLMCTSVLASEKMLTRNSTCILRENTT